MNTPPTAAPLPVVALTLGDPAGIGPELIAKLLARPDATSRANLVLIGDPWLWEAGQRVAGRSTARPGYASAHLIACLGALRPPKTG